MPSLLAQVAAARINSLQAQPKRSAVVSYSPGRVVPTALAQQAQAPRAMQPTRATPAVSRLQQRQQGGTDWDALQRVFQNSPEAQKQREDEAKAQAKANQPDVPWWKQALGTAVKDLLVPVGAIGVGRRAIEFAGAEFAQHAPEPLQRAVHDVVGITTGGGLVGLAADKLFGHKLAALNAWNPASYLTSTEAGGYIDPEQAKKVTKQGIVHEVLNPSSDLGMGQLLQQDQNQWRNRAIGLIGDVAFDPVTYVNPVPSARVLGGGSEALKGAAETAQTTLRQATKEAAAEGASRLPGADEALARLAQERDAAVEALRQTQRPIPIHGRADRVRLISEAFARDPEAAAKFGDEWLRGGQRGFNAMSPEARKALGIAEPALYFTEKGPAIPGTRAFAERASQLGGALRAARDTREIPLISRFTQGPKGFEAAYRTLTRGSKEMTPDEAALMGRVMGAYRQGEGSFKSQGNRILSSWIKDVYNKGKGATNEELVRASELSPERTSLNQMFSDMADLYEKISGDTIPRGANPDSYLPHILTPGFRRMLADNESDPLVASFKKKLDIVKEDLLEGSAHIEHARVLKPNTDGSAGIFNIGGQELTVENGSIDELNTKLKELFPSFKGKFYEDDPRRMGEQYLGSLGRAAGAKRGLGLIADEGTLGKRLTGPLWDAYQQYNEILARQYPEADLAARGYNPADFIDQATGEIINPLPERPPIPEEIGGVKLQDYFASTKSSKAARAATEARNETLKNQGVAYAKAARQDVAPVYKEARTQLKELRDSMLTPLKEQAKEADKLLPGLEDSVKASQQRLEQIFGPGLEFNQFTGQALNEGQRGQLVHELAAFHAGMNEDISAIEEALANKDQYFKRVAAKERRKLVDRLQSGLETLRNTRDDLRMRINDLPRELREEATVRQSKLEFPLRDVARKERNAVEDAARRVPAPSKDRVEWALQTLAGNSDEDRALIQAQHQAARDTIENRASLPRTEQGRLTPEARQTLADARNKQASIEAGLEPTQRTRMVTPAQYQRDEFQLSQMRGRLNDPEQADYIPVRNTRQRRVLQGQIDALQAKFNPGGEHYPITKAHEVLMEQADHEAARAEALAQHAQERQIANAAIRPIPQDPYAPTQVTVGGQRVPTEQSAIEQLKGMAALEESHNVLRGQRLAATEGEIASREQQIAETRAARGTVPQSVVDRKLQSAVTLPGGTMTYEEAQNFHQGLSDLRDTVGDETMNRITRLEQEGYAVQAKLLADTQNLDRLSAQRATAAELVPKLEAANTLKGKRPDLLSTLDDIEGVARANPNLDDESLNAAESLLQTHRQALELAGQKDMTRGQVQSMVTAAYEGRLGKVSVATLNDNWKAMHKGVLKEGDVILQRRIAAMYQNLTVLDKQPQLFGRTFNALTNLFKTYATLSPGFHVRNAMSGIFMNTSDGVGLARQFEGANLWGKYMKGGADWLEGQDQRVKDAFEAAFASGAGGRFTEAGVAGGMSDLKSETLASWYDKLASNKATRFSQRWGERVEGALRLGMALDSLDRGESISGALSRITRVHFDYGQISQFDKQMKPFIPFWTFMSRNLPLQISQMWTKPQAYQIYASVVRNFGRKPEDYTPQYWLDPGVFGAVNTGMKVPNNNLPILGEASGLPIYINPDLGATRVGGDISDIQNILSNPAAVLSNANPWLTGPIEYATHRNLYTGQNYGPTNYSTPEGFFGLPARVLAPIFGQTNQAGEVSENFQNLLRSVNPLLDRGARLTGSGGGTGKNRQAESIARFLGLPVRTLTPEQQRSQLLNQYYGIKDEADVLKAIARRQAQQAQQAS